MMSQAVLSVKDFSKSFFIHEQDKLIPSSQGVNFEVFSGQLTALVGPTGAGKSSILKGIYRTYLPSSGQIHYRQENGDVIDLVKASEHEILKLRQYEIGFVTQFLNVLPRQSTEDVVAMPLYHRGVDLDIAREQARTILAQLNLPERLWGISPTTFSGGEKQRVNLARGLLAKPRLLLLDEPTASLDPVTTARVIEIIQALKSDNVAILSIFHHPDIVEKLGDNIVELAPVAGTESFFEDQIV